MGTPSINHATLNTKVESCNGTSINIALDLLDISQKNINYNCDTYSLFAGLTPFYDNGGTIYRTDGFVSSVAFLNGKIITVNRDSDNLISDITDGTKTWTFTRTDGRITSWIVT